MSYPYGTKGMPAAGAAPGLPSRGGAPRGELVFTLPGLYQVTIPDGVTSICAVVGAPGGGAWMDMPAAGNYSISSGGGGGLAYKNNIPVYPGQAINVFVPAGTVGAVGTGNSALNAGTAYVIDTATCAATGGQGGAANVTPQGGNVLAGDGGGKGGNGVLVMNNSTVVGASGGAAAGYSGVGGNGSTSAGFAGTGSGATSGSGGGVSASGSGGVGMFGEGTTSATPGSGSSGGQNGYPGVQYGVGAPGQFCAGGSVVAAYSLTPGANGFARILWGDGRAFPSTDVGPS